MSVLGLNLLLRLHSDIQVDLDLLVLEVLIQTVNGVLRLALVFRD